MGMLNSRFGTKLIQLDKSYGIRAFFFLPWNGYNQSFSLLCCLQIEKHLESDLGNLFEYTRPTKIDLVFLALARHVRPHNNSRVKDDQLFP